MAVRWWQTGSTHFDGAAAELGEIPIEATFTPLGERVRYVNTASTAGGDGTSNLTSGATRAYASLTEAISVEKAVASDLVANLGKLIIWCSGSAADDEGSNDNNAQVDITGWTTSEDYNIEIRADPRHVGYWDTSAYRLEYQWAPIRIRVNASYTLIDGLQIAVGNGNVDPNQRGILIYQDAVDVTVQNCIIKYVGTTSSGAVGIHGGTDAAGFRFLFNNIIYDFSGTGGVGIRTVNHGADNTVIYHATIHNCTSGILDGYNDTILRNSIIQDCGTCLGADFHAFSGYFITSDSTGSFGTAAIINTSVLFVDESGDDFHLDVADVSGAIGGGTNLTSEVPYDIDGYPHPAWPNPPDMGADQTPIDTSEEVDVTDDNDVSVGETSANLLMSTRADAADVTLTEAVVVLSVLSRTDTAAITLSETSTNLLVSSRADAADVTLTEALAVLVVVDVTDGVDVTLTEAASVLADVVVDVADACDVTLTEAASLVIAAVVEVVDSCDVSLSEALTHALSSDVADTAAVEVAEAVELEVSLDVVDSADVSLGEAAETFNDVTADVADALDVTLAEAVTVGVTLIVVDTVGVALTEAPAVAVTLSVEEAVDVELFDDGQVALTVDVEDGADLDLDVTAGVEATGSLPFDVDDSLGVAAAESAVVTVTVDRWDHLWLAVREQLAIAAESGRVDDVNVALSESAAVAVLVMVAVSDSVDVAVVEAPGEVLIALEVLESVVVEAAEVVGELFVQLVRADGVGLEVSEAVALFGTLSVGEVVDVGVEELAELLLLQELFDSIGIQLVEVSGMFRQDYALPPGSRWSLLEFEGRTVVPGAEGRVTMVPGVEQRVMSVASEGRIMTVTAHNRTMRIVE